MSRRLIVLGAMLAGRAAYADAPGATPPSVADREIGGEVAIAAGGRTTPGGLRLGGRFLYQLTDEDWFDGRVAFTFGGGDAACFRDRADVFVCDHGALDGFAADLGGGIRRFVAGQQDFRPYLRAGIALRLARFRGDDVSGFALPISLGAGLRERVTDDVSLGGEATVEIGPAWYGRGLGGQLERGLVIGVFAEIALP